MTTHANRLAVYAQPAAGDGRGGFLSRSLGACLLVFGGLGLLLWNVDLPAVVQRPDRVAHRIAFHVPVPVPVKTATLGLEDPEFARTRSAFPSPLKSPTATP